MQLLSQLILLSLMRLLCTWLLPPGDMEKCADAGVSLIMLLTLVHGARTLWEGWGW